MEVVITFGCRVNDLSFHLTANNLEMLQLPMVMFLNFLKLLWCDDEKKKYILTITNFLIVLTEFVLLHKWAFWFNPLFVSLLVYY